MSQNQSRFIDLLNDTMMAEIEKGNVKNAAALLMYAAKFIPGTVETRT